LFLNTYQTFSCFIFLSLLFDFFRHLFSNLLGHQIKLILFINLFLLFFFSNSFEFSDKLTYLSPS